MLSAVTSASDQKCLRCEGEETGEGIKRGEEGEGEGAGGGRRRRRMRRRKEEARTISQIEQQFCDV